MEENQFAGVTPPQHDSGEDVKKDFKGLLGSVRKFLSELLEIRTNTDAVATKESIIADIPFKGAHLMDFNLFHFYSLHWVECQLYSCGNRSHVNFSLDGSHFRDGHVLGHQ